MQSLSQLVQQTVARAIERSAILPLQIESVTASEGDLNYSISYISSLSLKDMATALQKVANNNPFLPYEQDLYVTDLSPTHVLLLNKFPIETGHCMAVTRKFVPQLAALDAADFHALAILLSEIDGLAMFNGGKIGGASQPHKHFHVMPGRKALLESVFPIAGKTGEVQQIPHFKFRHAFMCLGDGAGDVAASAAQLQQFFYAALTHCGLDVRDSELPPYNLLATRRWMLIVPRSQECWSSDGEVFQVNALNYGGQVSARGPHQIDVVRKAGLLTMLEAASIPK